MPLEPYTGNADASRNLRIHKWISTLPSDLSKHHHHTPSIADTVGGRSDSPLLGFTSQENASNDPLHRPSPNYVRRLPEEVVLTNKAMQQAKSLPPLSSEVRIPSPVPEDVEKDTVILSPVIRNTPLANSTRAPAHLSYTQGRRPIPRQPSLPVFGTTSYHCQTFGPSVMPRTRSYSSAATVHSNFSSFPLSQMPHSPTSSTTPTTPTTRAPPPSPTVPTASLSSALERQKLNALVIASGLAAEEELQADGLGYHTNSSQVYLGEPTVREADSPVVVICPTTLRPSTGDSDVMNSTVTTSQTISSPRTSMLLEDLDEFDEDASFYGKDIDSFFSPYCCPARQSDEINQPGASKWSLSSSVDMDLNKGRRNSPRKLNKREKFKSFISRFTPNPPFLPTDKHATFTAADSSPEKSVRRLRSHSDALSSIAERNSGSSQVAIAHASWESVPPTPTTATSFTSMSISTGYSPATPSVHESDSRDTPIPTHLYRVSDEKLSPITGLFRIESPNVDTSSSLTWSGPGTSVPNSPVDPVAPPQLPLRHSVSTASLKKGSLKGLASIIGLAPADNSHGETVSGAKKTAETSQLPAPQPPRTFKERMMLKHNGSALSLILGKGNKTRKPKRKLLISGVERGDYAKYEAISSWCEAFGKVDVKQVADGAIIADFSDASVAETVCHLQARVYIKGAGSVNLSWTTNEVSSLLPSHNVISVGA